MVTTFLEVKNDVYSLLAADIAADAVSLTVSSGEGDRFPAAYPFHITIDDEIKACTNRVGDVLTITAAQQDTAAAIHLAGAVVSLNVTAKSVSDLNTAVNALETLGSMGADAWVITSDAGAEIKAAATLLESFGYPIWVCDGTADEVEVLAAIAAGAAQASEVKVVGSTLYTTDTITVLEHCHLDLGRTWIKPQADIDILYVKPGGCITGGYIWCDDVGASFTKAALLLDGIDTWGNYSGSSQSRIQGLEFHNTPGYGTAIYLIADGVAVENIFFAHFKDIRIYGFKFGVLIETAGGGSINANVFEGLVGAYCPYFIYCKDNGTAISGNWFDFQYQTQSPTLCVVNCEGNRNRFEGFLWDTSAMDGLVKNEDLSASSPITCTLLYQPSGLGDRLHWVVSGAVFPSIAAPGQITQFSLNIVGLDVDGGALDETFTQADGWLGDTAGAFASITSITFTRVAGTGAGDYLFVGHRSVDTAGQSNLFDLTISGYPLAPYNYRNLGVNDTLPNVFYDRTVGAISKLRIESPTGGGVLSLVPSALTTSNRTITIPSAEDATLATAAEVVKKDDYGAYSILAADTIDVPASIALAASQMIGRKAAGGIVALAKADVLTLINVEDGADVTDATNVDVAGAVMEGDYGAYSILAADTVDTPASIALAASQMMGRKATGGIVALAKADILTIINVADGADVTGSNAPQAHKASHEDTGGDEISIAGLAGESAELTTHKGLTTGIHGVGAGAIVGTALTQALSNKTLTAPVINGEVTTTGLTLPATSFNADINIAANKIKTTNLLLKEFTSSAWSLRNVADSAYVGLYLGILNFYDYLQAGANALSIRAGSTDGNYILFYARDTGVGFVEVASMRGAADPYFGLGVDGAGIKVTNANLVGFFAAAPVAQQIGADELNTGYVEADIDTNAELVAVINVITTEINALRTATNNLGLTTVV